MVETELDIGTFKVPIFYFFAKNTTRIIEALKEIGCIWVK